MHAVNKSHLDNKGFTLVELLIVVAIIGVLATVGVPSFRLMVQKSKKSEAKVALGGLYTAETAFFSEYGAYGNNLPKVGFEMDGQAATRLYVVGFPSATCADPAAIVPTLATPQGVGLNAAFPAYYTGVPTYVLQASRVLTACEPATVPNDGATFTASATAIISPKATAASDYDGWTIDQTRSLRNTKEGMM